MYVLLDGEYVYIPPDSDCRPHTSSAAGGYIGEGSASASEPVLSVLAAQRELRAAVSLYKVIGRRAQPQIQAKTLQLADALFAAGATPNAEALYQSVFEWAGADYGGRSELAQRAAQGLARVYRARGEDAKAEWVRFTVAPALHAASSFMLSGLKFSRAAPASEHSLSLE